MSFLAHLHFLNCHSPFLPPKLPQLMPIVRSIWELNQLPKGIKWSAVPLPCSTFLGSLGEKQGSGPNRVQSPVEWGIFCLYIHLFPPLGYPGLGPASQAWSLAGCLAFKHGCLGLKHGWLGLRPGRVGLRPGWMAQRGGKGR